MNRTRWRWQAAVGAVALLGFGASWAEPPSSDVRAQRNYLHNCVGCHQTDGSGAPAEGVPSFQGMLGSFLHVSGGREYIVQVPGVMNSSLHDRDIAELMNWLLPRVAGQTLPPGTPPYTAEEIARLRKSRPLDFAATRRDLVSRMREAAPSAP
jgi:cytochrome c553